MSGTVTDELTRVGVPHPGFAAADFDGDSVTSVEPDTWTVRPASAKRFPGTTRYSDEAGIGRFQ